MLRTTALPHRLATVVAAVVMLVAAGVFLLTHAPEAGATADPAAASPAPSVDPTADPTDCAAAVLCDGFEDLAAGAPAGSWTTVFPDCSGAGSAVVDPGVARTGGRSLRIDGATGYCNHVFVTPTVDLAGIGPAWYGRFHVRHTTALPAEHVTFLALRDTADGGKDLRMGGQNAALQWNRQSDDATLPEQSPSGVALSVPLATDTWTCVEFAVDGTAGTLTTWIDGAEVAGLHTDGVPTHDVDGQWLRRADWRPALTDFRLGWESYGSGADTLWFDDVALGAARLGC
ncbi:MAG TPA: hypothetical protein VFO77_08065 [Actinoplanes sp.]|nr:hypothetical protein [Actinoplanes sp.]